MDKACLEIRDLMALGSDTSRNERMAIESHVSICAECARELAEARTLTENLALLREGAMPPGTVERIWRGVESAVPGRKRVAILAWSVRAAAILVIGLSVGFTAVSIGRANVAPAMTAAEEATDISPSTLIPHPVEPAFGSRTAVPEGPSVLELFQLLPQHSSSYYLPSVMEILEPDEVRF